MAPQPDPRPLVGEPLALDLLNTEWIGEAGLVDFFTTEHGLDTWLASAEIAAPPADDDVRRALTEARAAIRGVVSPGAGVVERQRLNEILGRGRVHVAVDRHGTVTRHIEVAAPAWRPAVLAAFNLTELLETAPDRIRRCDHPNCVLWFFDTSRNGTRRWCSMASCGNRAKAQRHYDRSRRTAAKPGARTGTDTFFDDE